MQTKSILDIKLKIWELPAICVWGLKLHCKIIFTIDLVWELLVASGYRKLLYSDWFLACLMPWVLFQHLGHIVPLKISSRTIDNHHTWPASPLPTAVATATHQTRIVCIFTVITLCTMTDSFHQLHLTLVIVSLHLTITTTGTISNLHATPCNIVFYHNSTAWWKWPWNSVWMRMLSPVSIKWFNVTKTSLFPVVFNFHHS